MPEILEVEIYRRSIEPIVGRAIRGVQAPDPWFLKGGLDAGTLSAALVGGTVVGVRRHGKLLLVDVGRRARRPTDTVLGLRFGMTGRPFLDDGAAPMTLEYGSARADTAWDRFTLEFAGGGRLRINDPRRLGGFELDADESRLGPDALALGLRDLRRILRSRAPVKAVLIDQQRIAGLGNMLADECLWRAGIDPARPADRLTDVEVRRLHRTIRSTLPAMLAAGGSHTGGLGPTVRTAGAVCPRDGAPLLRRSIGGRTTFSCSVHQR